MVLSTLNRALAVYSRQRTPYQLNNRLSGSQRHSGSFGEEKKLFSLKECKPRTLQTADPEYDKHEDKEPDNYHK
jgi:hypothetical protein